jgi:hypothetical protein
VTLRSERRARLRSVRGERLASGVAARSQAQHASCNIEAIRRELVGKPSLTPALRRRL